MEAENDLLKTSISQVKEDIKAVLDQYDKELTGRKQVQKKHDKLKETNRQLIDELNQQRIDMDQLNRQL